MHNIIFEHLKEYVTFIRKDKTLIFWKRAETAWK